MLWLYLVIFAIAVIVSIAGFFYLRGHRSVRYLVQFQDSQSQGWRLEITYFNLGNAIEYARSRTLENKDFQYRVLGVRRDGKFQRVYSIF